MRNQIKVSLLLWLIAASLLCMRVSAESLGGQPSITFAQLTDAHIFDDGYNKPTPDALEQVAEDRRALLWAIKKINALAASGVPIDFVVYSGDFGLQNVDFPAGDACKVLNATVDPGTPMTTVRWAADEIAKTLDQLSVRKVFFVSGNNDIVAENITDSRRLDCFLNAVQSAAKRLPVPLQLAKLDPDSKVEVNGIHLAGLNSASFKNDTNYSGPCTTRAAAADAAMLREACPASQMALLRKFNSEGPLVLFTHVPDLKDPYRKAASWTVAARIRQAWEQQVCAPAVLAVFSGHFHDSTRAIYGSNTATADLATSACVAAKTWVAPPLAAKNQTDKSPQARGFLLATVASTGVLKVEPIWYEQPDSTHSPCKPCSGSGTKPAIWWTVLSAVLVTLLALVCLIILAPKGWAEKHRDLNAILVTVVFVGLAFLLIWLVKGVLGIADSATLIALLILPLLIYGIASGRLTEFSGPGGWGAKFAKKPVDISLQPIEKDAPTPEVIAKADYAMFREQLRHGGIREGRPLLLTLTMQGGPYDEAITREYLRALSSFPNFTLVTVLDKEGRLVAYVPGRTLMRASDLNLPDFPNFVHAVNNNDLATLTAIPGVLTETITPQTTNAEALQVMEKLDLDVLPVVNRETGRHVSLADRRRILSRLLLGLAGADRS